MLQDDLDIANWFEAILDNAPDSIMGFKAVRTKEGIIKDLEYLFVSKKALLSAGKTEVVGTFLTKESSGIKKNGLFDRYAGVIETGKSWSGEIPGDTDATTSRAYVSVVKAGDGCLVSYLDITNFKNGEEQLNNPVLQLSAQEEITKLNKVLLSKNRELAFLNSELKTFNNIAANDYSETLRHLYINLELIVSNDAQSLSNSGRANLRRAQSAIQKMKLLTDDLKAYTRIQEIDAMKQEVDLNAVLKGVLTDFDNLADNPEIKVECDQMPHVTGYPFLISLVFHHLIDNAIKFRKDGGQHSIHISCKESMLAKDLPADVVPEHNEYHVITVSDDGIGFSPEETKNIFHIFYRLHDKTHFKGSGIGLAICKKVMDIHGGFITAEGEPDKGAIFHCYFPAG